MKPIKQVFLYLYPVSLLEGTNLRLEWHRIASQKFILRISWLMVIGAAAYVFHYPFVDVPAKKQPLELWFYYRFGMASLALLSLGWYQAKFLKGLRHSKVPALVASSLFCYFQGQTMLWHPGTPFFFSFVMAAVLAVIVGESMLTNMLYFTCFIALQWGAMNATQVPHYLMISYTFMALGVIVLVSSRYRAEIQLFISERNVKIAEKKNIEMTMEFSSLIQSFLPLEIVKRYRREIDKNAVSPLQALEEVLRRKKVQICCVYSDIRNYTARSKDLDFLGGNIMTDIQSLHKPIEEFGGIPRKIGDLIFAYFDGPRPDINILKCICATIEVAQLHHLNNSQISGKIERRFVITAGEAFCGNIGFLDSMIEITALGLPVNLAARIDEVTKNP
ncbi:MAG: hypothetical protein EOP06_11615, partial [Proteobacteria bacterium]